MKNYYLIDDDLRDDILELVAMTPLKECFKAFNKIMALQPVTVTSETAATVEQIKENAVNVGSSVQKSDQRGRKSAVSKEANA